MGRRKAMAFRKGSNNTERLAKKLAEIEGEEPVQLTDQQRLDFPEGLQYARDERIWMVKEAYKDGPDDYRRVVSLDSGDEEIMLLNVLKKDATSSDFTFIK